MLHTDKRVKLFQTKKNENKTEHAPLSVVQLYDSMMEDGPFAYPN